MKDYIFYAFVILAILCWLGVLGGKLITTGSQVSSLQQKLEQAQQQLAEVKQLAGKPINVADLPKCNYRRIDDKRFAFVKVESDSPIGTAGPAIAVYCDKGIPYLFNPKNIGNDASDF